MPIFTHIRFDASEFAKSQVEDLTGEEVWILPNEATWVQSKGVYNEDIIIRLAKQLKVSPLWLYQSVKVGQKARFEASGEHTLIVLQVPRYHPKQYQYHTEQIAFLMGDTHLFSFQPTDSDLVQGVEELLADERNPLRRGGVPYLMCALLDTCLEQFNQMVSHLENQTANLQTEVRLGAVPVLSQRISGIRQECITVQKHLQPISLILKRVRDILPSACHVYLQELQDLVQPLLDKISQQFLHLDDLIDIHLVQTAHFTQRSVQRIGNLVMTILPIMLVVCAVVAYFYFADKGYNMSLWGIGFGLISLASAGMIFLFRKNDWF